MVYFVGAGSGATDLITVRGARLLGEADTVIYAVGQEALADEAMALYDCAGRFYPLGDCMVPNNIADANKMGETIALDIGRI